MMIKNECRLKKKKINKKFKRQRIGLIFSLYNYNYPLYESLSERMERMNISTYIHIDECISDILLLQIF